MKEGGGMDVPSWKPYEQAYTENIAMRWIPRRFYQLRWRIMHYNPLCWTVRASSWTYGEALCFVLVTIEAVAFTLCFGLDVNGFRTDTRRTGGTSSLMLMTAYILALHNNVVLLLFFGLPFERTLFWHKLVAGLSLYHGVLHATSYYVADRTLDEESQANHPEYHIGQSASHRLGMEISGWVLWVMMGVMLLTGLPWFLRRCFAEFYRIHVVLAVLVAVTQVLHGFGSAATSGIIAMSLPGIIFWFGDIAVRMAFLNYITRTSKAQIRLIQPSEFDDETDGTEIVELKYPNSRGDYMAGQWVFICLPKLGLLHWHPFTISSANDDGHLTLHAGALGRWTGAVAKLAKDKPLSDVTAYLEGPYGAPMIDIHGERYKVFLIISGGLGWSFLRAWKRQLLHEASRGRKVLVMHVVAVLKRRDVFQMPEFRGWPEPEGVPETEPADVSVPSIQLRETVYITSNDSNAPTPEMSQSLFRVSVPRPPIAEESAGDENFLKRLSARVNALARSSANAGAATGASADAGAEPSEKPEAGFLQRVSARVAGLARLSAPAGAAEADAHVVDLAPEMQGPKRSSGQAPETEGTASDETNIASLERSSAGPEARGGAGGLARRSARPPMLVTVGSAEVRPGRPKMDSIFAKAVDAARAVGERRVAVLCCASRTMTKVVLKECAAASRDGMQVKCHWEIFGFD